MGRLLGGVLDFGLTFPGDLCAAAGERVEGWEEGEGLEAPGGREPFG